MKLTMKKSVATAAVALIAAAGLSACGSDDKGAATKSDDKKTETAAGSGLTKETFFTEIANAQKDAKTGAFDIKAEASGQSVAGKGAVSLGASAKDTAVKMDMEAAGQSVKIVLVDSKLYANVGQASQNKYTVTDTTDANNPTVKQLQSSLRNVDPAKQFEELEPAVTKFENKGAAEKIDGEDVTEYALAVDPKKIPSIAEAPGASALPSELTYSLFVGSDNLLRRVTVDAPIEMVINYTNWGDPVDIKAPPASEIIEMPTGG